MRITRSAVAGLVAVAGLIVGHAGAPAGAAELDCLMQPREIVTVSAALEGVLEQVAVDRGDTVEKGAVLAMLELRVIRSPITGVVMERLRHPGELASREHPVVRLARLDPLRVEVFVPIALYGRITPGQRTLVVPETPLNRPLEATVTVVDKVADAASGTFGVRLEVANPGNRVPGGLKCKVRLGEPKP